MTKSAEEVAGDPRCASCRFTRNMQYRPPDPVPEPRTYRYFFGLFEGQDPPSWEHVRAVLAHDAQLDRHKNYVPCMRFPEMRPVLKTHWCGEYQPLLLPSHDKEAQP